MDQLVQPLNQPYDTGVVSEISSKVTFKWTIKDFTTIKGNELAKMLTSSIFTTVGSKSNWYITLSLTDNNEWCLSLINYETIYGVRGKITVELHKNNNVANNSVTLFEDGSCQPYIIPKVYCVLGSLIIRCNVTEELVYKNIYYQIENERRLKECDDFELILPKDEHTDITLFVMGEEMHVHKYVLAKKSQVFATMFRCDMIEKQKNVVEIKDVAPEVMKELIKYMYTGKVEQNDNQSFVKALYKAADKYSLDGLKVICEDMMIRNLSLTNAIDSLWFAAGYGSKKLRNSFFDFVVSNHEVLKLTTFQSEYIH